MRNLIEKLSARAEFWLIVLVSFGYFIVGSSLAFVTHRGHVLSDRWAVGIVVFELLVALFVVWIGQIRGWTLGNLGLRPTWRYTGAGVLLYLAATISVNAFYMFVASIYGASIPRAMLTAHGLSFSAVAIVTIINPLFEETLVVGYVVHTTSEHGPGFAIAVSALIRFLYHTYQGPVAAVCILPLGIVFAFVYWRFRQLWPLVIA